MSMVISRLYVYGSKKKYKVMRALKLILEKNLLCCNNRKLVKDNPQTEKFEKSQETKNNSHIYFKTIVYN